MPKPPISTVAPSSMPATASSAPTRRRAVIGSTSFSSTTASAWPTPMQIAATPHRSPDSASRLRERAEDPGAGRAERVADRDRAALGVDDLRVDLPGVDAGQRLHRERLVELDRADVGPADAGPGQSAGWPPRPGRSRSPAGRARGRRGPAIRASGSMPIEPAAAGPSRSAAPTAPSLSGEALPAVIVPSGRNAGFSAGQLLGRGAGPDPLVARRARRPRPATTRSS